MNESVIDLLEELNPGMAHCTAEYISEIINERLKKKDERIAELEQRIRELEGGLRIIPTVEYGCYIDLDPDMKPDGCVLDENRAQDCEIAQSLLKGGKTKLDCKFWNPKGGE